MENQWGEQPGISVLISLPQCSCCFFFLSFFYYCSFLFHLLRLSKPSGCLKDNPLWLVSCYPTISQPATSIFFGQIHAGDTTSNRPERMYTSLNCQLNLVRSILEDHTLLVSSDHQVRCNEDRMEWCAMFLNGIV